jgi:pimeloyl-ACP methyl ester carboxylesterase
MKQYPSSVSEQPTIVFSHANSFPAGTYASLFGQWRAAGYQVKAIDKFGHDPRYPVTPDWPHLVEQLHHFVRDEVKGPAYLVGHSLGGYLSMMLASRQPALAAGVVVLDSPLLHGLGSWSIGLAKRLGQMPMVMPSRIAASRCHQWASRQDAHEHFGAKRKFAAFHPQVLSDYLTHGIDEAATQQRATLSFRREVEADIYNCMPHRLVQEFARHPPHCPLAFIGGQRSKELRQVGLRGTRRIFGEHFSWIEGTHLYPFEQPQRTAEAVLQWLHQFRMA